MSRKRKLMMRTNDESTQSLIFNIIKYSVLLVVFESVLIFLFLNNPLRYFLGLMFGFFFNLIFFRLMYLNVNKVVGMSEGKAKRYVFANYLARYIITGFVLLIAGLYSQLSIFTCFLGLLTIKIVIYIRNFVLTIKTRQTK